MNHKVFQNKIKKIQQIYDFVTDSSRSRFYHLFYTKRDHNASIINDYDDFLKIPSLNRDDILETALLERNYLPEKETKGFSVTSGTTKNKRVLVLPFSHPSESFANNTINPNKMKTLGVTKIIYVTSPLHGMVRHMIYANDNTLPFVLSKPDNLVLTANIIKEAHIEGIISTPTILTLLIAELVKIEINNRIKWVCLAGEHCSNEKRDVISKSLPNASIEMVYGSAEAGIIGIQCDETRGETNHFHPVEEIFLEVLDDDGKPQKQDTPGKIVITSLTKKAFPLIRYDIKDMASLEFKKCKCGASETFKLLGRSELDSVKIQGTLIHAEAIERALSLLKDTVESDYKLSVYERKVQNKMLPELVIELVPKEKFIVNPQDFLDKITKVISKNLWLSPKKTLDDLVTNDIFLPLKVELVDKIEKNPNGKNSSIYNFTI